MANHVAEPVVTGIVRVRDGRAIVTSAVSKPSCGRPTRRRRSRPWSAALFRSLAGSVLARSNLSLGWDRSRWRRQISRVHNKGILVDGRIAVVGSQSWSGDGTQVNRDASLVFEAEDIAEYFGGVFEFDWANLTKPIETLEVTPLIAEPGAPTPIGMVRVPWRAWFAELI